MKVKCPKFIKKLLYPILKLNSIVWDKVKRSIRLELLLVFLICLLSSILAGSIANSYFGRRSYARLNYSDGIARIDELARGLAERVKNEKISINDEKVVQNLPELNNIEKCKILITDLDGKVLYKTDNSNDAQINIYDTVKNTMDSARKWNDKYNIDTDNQTSEYISFYPANFSDGRGYIITSGYPEPHIIYEYSKNNGPEAIAMIATFLLLFYFITNKKMKYIEVVSNGLLEISKGNLDFRIKKTGEDELASLANNINNMAYELKNKIDDERKAEKTKSELITNVSHDLRTPLTSIKGYLGLIKDRKYTEETQLEQFVNIAYNKTEKLEVLINDLFEYTKLTNNVIALSKENIALDELLEQLCEELVPICEENNIVVNKEFTSKKVIVDVDPNKTMRVFENLFMNAIRYSLKPGTIKVLLTKEEEFALVSVQNKCEDLSEEDLSKIFDRFYRVDKSRSSDTGGSGLGLAIARNILELQGGTIDAKFEDGCVSFNVRLKIG